MLFCLPFTKCSVNICFDACPPLLALLIIMKVCKQTCEESLQLPAAQGSC